MVNLDMVGRCNEKKLNVGGVGTARGLRELVEKANEVARYHVTYDPGGTAPTDSTSFFRKKVPVLFFFTGIHEDYHRPTDTFDRVCFDELAGITRFVADVVTMIADADERLVYTEPPRPPRPPLLGIQLRPEGDERGVPVGGVLPGGPAATAGLQAGDVIVDLAGRIVRTPEDLRAVLVGLQAGKGVGVTVLRGAEAVHLDVVPVARGR
jgi:membrane-associated protease RseP (regulator of RpoE activity)